MEGRPIQNRRAFLKFVAGSPLLGSLIPLVEAWSQEPEFILKSPADALNVLDFEAAARQAIPPAHFGYLATGVDSDLTVKANRDAFSRYQLRPRRLVDVSRIDMSTTLFGKKWEYPIGIAPVGSQKAFHADGEIAVAKAAQAKKAVQVLSTVATSSIEDVNAARGEPVWFQLYTTSRWEAAVKLVKRAEAAGCPVLAVTVDLQGGRNTETQDIFRRKDTRTCNNCHSQGTYSQRKPMLAGVARDAAPGGVASSALTWDSIKKLRDVTTMKIVLKGIETREDALLGLRAGVDGIIVSNHGGRAEESGRGTLECLPEVVQACAGRIPVMVDGGFRRGTDVFKALALGARAVFIGRPYIWGLGAFGQPGVEAVLDIMRRELGLVMRQCGARSVKEITPAFLAKARPL